MGEEPSAGVSGAKLSLAEMYLSRGDLAQALTLTAELLQADPQSTAAHYLRVQVALQVPDAAVAEASLQTLLEQDPNWAPAHVLAGEYYAYLAKDAIRAEEHFRTAVRLEPSDPIAPTSYGIFLAQRRRVEEGITLARRGFKQDPENPYILHALQVLYRLNKEPELAEEFGEKALAVDPENPHHHLEVGLNQLAQGPSGKASSFFRESLRLAPDNSDNRETMAFEQVRQHPFFVHGFFLSFRLEIVAMVLATPVFWYFLSLLFHPFVYVAWISLAVGLLLYGYHGLFRFCVWRNRRRIERGRL